MDLIISPPKFQMLDGNGDPLAGGKVNTYGAGGDTPETTYSNYALSVENANPVVLDSRGEAKIFCANALKLVITDSDDGAIYTFDNVQPIQLSVLAAVSTALAGITVRSLFEYKDTDEIYFGPGSYHHQGVTEQIVYWDSQLTFQLAGVGTEEWRYIYIDDSGVVTAGTNLLTASEFAHSTTAPTWSAAKHGWYNGADRCIFAVYIDAGGNIEKFYHDGTDLVFFDDYQNDRAAAVIGVDWSDTITLTIPAFATRALVTFQYLYVDTDTYALYRQGDSSATGAHFVGWVGAGSTRCINTLPVITNASQVIDVRETDAAANTLALWTEGFYLPRSL